MREATESMHYAAHRAATCSTPSHPAALTRIAVGVDGYPEGSDAVALGAAMRRLVGGELLLVAVHPGPLVVLPPEVDWKSVDAQARAMLARARDGERATRSLRERATRSPPTCGSRSRPICRWQGRCTASANVSTAAC